MKKNKQDLLTFSILTLITVLTWIGFDVYQALTRYTIPEILDKQIQPLNPKLNQETINQLKERLQISEEELTQLPTPQIEPESTESAEIPEEELE